MVGQENHPQDAVNHQDLLEKRLLFICDSPQLSRGMVPSHSLRSADPERSCQGQGVQFSQQSEDRSIAALPGLGNDCIRKILIKSDLFKDIGMVEEDSGLLGFNHPRSYCQSWSYHTYSVLIPACFGRQTCNHKAVKGYGPLYNSTWQTSRILNVGLEVLFVKHHYHAKSVG